MINEYFYEIEEIYKSIEKDIKLRLDEFKKIWENGDNKDIFCELAFCILTPQSKARNAWSAITTLRENKLLFVGEEEQLIPYLNTVRFNKTKAKNLVLLREQMKDKNGDLITKDFFNKFEDVFIAREWLVKNIRGISYKEASHFLRNIGFGERFAILDRHILKNLIKLGVIDSLPKSLTPKLYKEIENKLSIFCDEVNIPMGEMDLLLWYKEAKEIFK